MKTKQRFLVFSLSLSALLILFLAACDSDLGDINSSPNAVSESNVKSVLGQRAVLVGMQAAVGDWYSDERSRITSVWTMHMCAPSGLGRPQPVSWNTYKMTRDEHVDRAWIQAYRVVKLANDIIDNSGSVGFAPEIASTYLGIAKFYKALALAENAALYGSIPIDVQKTAGDPFPQFVSQQVAYNTAQSLLTSAIADFTAANVTAANTIPQDLNFGGISARWVGAAYSLKARYYLHTSKANAGDLALAITNANSGLTSTVGVAVNSIHTLTAGEYAPWGHWSQTEAGEPLRTTKYFVDLLNSEPGDTRKAAYFAVKGGATAIVGFDVYGDLGGTGDELVTTRAAGLVKYRGYNASFPLISYQENLLIRAEAEGRVNGITAPALADLNAIRTAAGLTSRVAGDFANTTAFLAEVLKQKYLQLHLEGQAYHDMRRATEYPLPRAGIPIRWIYGQSETLTNPNVPADPASNPLF